MLSFLFLINIRLKDKKEMKTSLPEMIYMFEKNAHIFIYLIVKGYN